MTDNLKSNLTERVQVLQDEAVRAYEAGLAASVPVERTERPLERRERRERGAVRETPIVDVDAFERAKVEAIDLSSRGHAHAVWTVQGVRFRVDPVGIAPYQWTVYQTDTNGPPPCNKWRHHADD